MAQRSAASSRVGTPVGSPAKGAKKTKTSIVGGSSTPLRKESGDQQQLDIAGLNLNEKTDVIPTSEEPPKMSLTREKVLEEAKQMLGLQNSTGKKAINLIVIGDFLLMPVQSHG